MRDASFMPRALSAGTRTSFSVLLSSVLVLCIVLAHPTPSTFAQTLVLLYNGILLECVLCRGNICNDKTNISGEQMAQIRSDLSRFSHASAGVGGGKAFHRRIADIPRLGMPTVL